METFASPADTRIQLCGRLAVELGAPPARDDFRVARVASCSSTWRRAGRAPSGATSSPTCCGRRARRGAADASLSALLSELRRVLGPGTLTGKSELRLALPPDAWIDLEAAGVGVHGAESAVALGTWTRVGPPAPRSP